MTAGQAPSLAAGAACGLGDLEGRTLVQAIAGRVARVPEGRFWSLRQSGRPRSRTYGELWARSGRIANGLAARALPLGSPVVLMLEDGLDFLPAFWACLRAGLVPVPLAPAAENRLGDRPLTLSAPLVALAPRLVLADAAVLPASLREALPCACMSPAELDGHAALTEEPPPTEMACVLATSGSTGTAKLIALSDRAMLHRAFTTCHPALSDSGATINTFPLDSTSGIACTVLGSRECVHLPMATLAREPTFLFDAVETFRASSLSITDTMASRVAEAAAASGGRWDLSSLRQVGLGAEAVLLATVRRFASVLQRFGAPGDIIRAGYGTTETGTLLTGADPLAADLVGGLGVPLGAAAPNVAIRVVDGAGAVLPEGTVGEVEVHAPLKMFSSYWGDPEATAAGFTADGWWRTGDAGLLWGGELALRGRTKEVFIANGRKHALGAIDDAMRDALDPGDTAYACVIPGGGDVPEGLGVALVLGSPGRQADAEGAVRRAVGQAFGVQVAAVRALLFSALPLTPTGKVKRADLAALLSAPATSPEPGAAPGAGERAAPSPPVGTALEAVWEAALGPGSAANRDADFFILGGDSLRSIDLFSRVERATGVAVDPTSFFAEPTLATLRKLVQAPSCALDDDGASSPELWPLSPRQHRDLLIYVETWGGERPTPDRLVASFNGTGSKAPIFLVCQVEYEVRDLARHLGPDQPVFAFRSGHLIIEHRDYEVQALALRYVADVETLCPEGPVLLSGVCQGGTIALAMAQHLLRRRRHVPLLALIESPESLQPYPSRVLLLYGRDSAVANPYLKFREPERGWERHHAEVEAVEVPGDHRTPMLPAGIELTAAILADRFDRALRLPAHHFADEHRRVRLNFGPLPSRIAAGRSFAVNVSVTNASAVPWSETARSGLLLGCYWLDSAGNAVETPGGRAVLPSVLPNVPECVLLTVTAPASASRLSLVVDVVEEGSVWFGTRRPEGMARAAIDIAAEGDVDDGVHLVIDGLATFGHGTPDALRFVIPAGARDLRLVSPTFVAPTPDTRRLGVTVTRLTVEAQGLTRTVPLDHSSLRTGFHDMEGDGNVLWRWTDGEARIDRDLLTRFSGDVLLSIEGQLRVAGS